LRADSIRIAGVDRIADDALWFLDDLPPAGQTHFWEAGGGRRVAWSEYGEPAGYPLVYCHGWPSSRQQARLVHHLARVRRIRVLALDRPGMGCSTRQTGRTLLDWPPLVAAFADAHGIRQFLQLAVSGGAPYVLACAACLPERVTASAVLCGAVPLAAGDVAKLAPAYRLVEPLRRLPKRLLSLPIRLAAGLALREPERLPISLLLRTMPAADRELLLSRPAARRVIAESVFDSLSRGAGVLDDAEIYFHDWHLPLENMRQPPRYWHGGADQVIPVELARRFLARIPGARLDIVPAEGHFSLAVHRATAAMDHLAASIPFP
jgi:pimeloyl-ACP methyl ester carboxylesterase